MDQTTALPGTIEMSDDPRVLRTKSQDFNWFSPVLKAQLEHKSADTVYFPADRHELRDIVRHAFLHKRPIVVRGGGTGNYGQCVPLAGGCVIDMARLDGILEVTDTSVTAEAGIRIDRLQARLHDDGRELRLYPSSLRMSSLGGFLGGGAGGVG
ncbi:MAG: FAD-binding oxidoreductase [Sphingomonas taxi]